MNIKNILRKLFAVPETPPSEADVFLNQFDLNNPHKSSSQLYEIKQRERIKKLRDLSK